MEIAIPFNEWSRIRLASKVKTATSRYKRYGFPGDTFRFGDIEYKLTLVEKLPLWFIAKELYQSEGAKSPKEFLKVWREIYSRRQFKTNEKVFFHYFKIHQTKNI